MSRSVKKGPFVEARLLGREVVVVLGVRGRAREDACAVARGSLRHEAQDRAGVLDPAAADGRRDEVRLAGGPAEVLGGGRNAHDLIPYRTAVERSVFLSCPRNVRVGANSPNR